MNRFLFCCILLYPGIAICGHLKPGFDIDEYKELLKISAKEFDSTNSKKALFPMRFRMIYRSPIIGLDNKWDLWTDNDSVAVISTRGTTQNKASWLANFYAAMVPAKGKLVFCPNDTFKYELASDPKAAVHVGWLVSTAFLVKDMLRKIDSLHRRGIKDFIITGHSQGGAISYLITAYLYQLQSKKLIPADIRFKTYCSAAPKPGNLYFAYEYEHARRGGWAFNVVNSADWVPESPMSIQTMKDFNITNPFINAKEMIRKQKFPKNIILRYIFNRLDKPTRKAERTYQKFLGRIVSKYVEKQIKGFHAPKYYNSNHYVRTGFVIVLLADSTYYTHFPDSEENVFVHHMFEPYMYLAKRYK